MCIQCSCYVHAVCMCALVPCYMNTCVGWSQVNYQKASLKKWDSNMVPKDLDSPDTVQAEGEGNWSLHEPLSTHLEAGNGNHHNGSNVKADRDFFTLKSDVVCGLVLGVHVSLCLSLSFCVSLSLPWIVACLYVCFSCAPTVGNLPLRERKSEREESHCCLPIRK